MEYVVCSLITSLVGDRYDENGSDQSVCGFDDSHFSSVSFWIGYCDCGDDQNVASTHIFWLDSTKAVEIIPGLCNRTAYC